MKKLLVVLVLLAVVGWLGFQIYRRVSAPSGRPARGASGPVAVETAPVRRTTIRDVGRFTGSVLARSRLYVAPKIGGRLEKLLVNIGDTVRNGQLIAQIDGAEYVQQEKQAQAELAVAKANVEQALSNLDVTRKKLARFRRLYEKKVTSESEIEVVEAEYKVQEAVHEVAKARVLQSEAALETTRVQLSYARISVSWEDGGGGRLVAERFMDEGAMLKANEPIVSIIDISSVTAMIHVIERDYGKVTVGQEATVTTDALPGQSFRCKVARVAPLLRETSRQARVEMDVPNPEGLLKPGMFVRAEIEFARQENATVVPTDALVKRNGSQGIFVLDETHAKARFVPVRLGIVEGDTAQVLEPSVTGLVVTLGQHLLEDGFPVKLPEKKPEASSPPDEGFAVRRPSPRLHQHAGQYHHHPRSRLPPASSHRPDARHHFSHAEHLGRVRERESRGD